MDYKLAREVGDDMGPISVPSIKSNVLKFTRAKTCAEVNRETTDGMLRDASDADLAAIVAELGKLASERRSAFYDTLDEYTRALCEQSRRASRG